MISILVEAINKLEESKQEWLDTAQECKEFEDFYGESYSRGVVTGIDESIKKLEKMFDEELEKYAAGN